MQHPQSLFDAVGQGIFQVIFLCLVVFIFKEWKEKKSYKTEEKLPDNPAEKKEEK